jgi:arginine-tRNA-protein transferase
LIPGSPPELIVYDRPQRCPYLRDRVARMPLRLPARALERSELDQRLEAGDRRQGFVLYRTACPSCEACEPIRLDVRDFKPSRSQRRVFQRGEQEIHVEMGPPVVDPVRVALYNKHKHGRGLSDGQPPIDAEGYRDFLVSTCCDSFEIRYRIDSQLVGIAIVDRSANSLSAVYCYYDPG